MSQSHQLLIIGGPNVGKTHFVGQLYNRLVAKASTYRMVTPPADLSVIKAIIDRLALGLAGEHTQRGLNEEINFTVARGQTEIALAFPDYAGEQVRDMVRERLVSSRWRALIEASDEWLLFIRPEDILPLEDITTRGFADLDDLRRRASQAQADAELTPPAFYVELLQLLLHVKGKSAAALITAPRLTTALSCWDRLDAPNAGTAPLAELRARLPFLADFLATVWAPGSWRVLGLSSLGRTLDPLVPDEDFVDDGPAAAGYVVLPTGEQHSDLTQLITF